MDKASISLSERKRLIAQISKASGVAQYALLKKMSNAHVIQAAQHLEILRLLKPSNDYNRYCQAKKTGEANKKLKEFTDLHRSELLKAGKWLFNALSKSGSDRQQTLLERELVHRDDYNSAVTEMRETITELDQNNEDMTHEAITKIQQLEKRINTLKSQQIKVKQYITQNYGSSDWQLIKQSFKLDA